jgi:dihydroorotate dehydrogenase electron transfer subunit
MKKGVILDAEYFLGNGFKLSDSERKIMLIGGGMGAAPLYSVIKGYKDREFYPYIGFQTKDRIILQKEYSSFNAVIATDDGTYGQKGFVTKIAADDLDRIKPDIILACGPKPMLRALAEIKNYKVLVSVEERMGCGIGACLDCACKTLSGNKRVCKDGPVFDIKELVL